MGLRKINGELIRKVRGKRSRDEISLQARKMGNPFSAASLWAWENEHWKPTDQNILTLCEILGCNYEDISVPVTRENVAALAE